MGVWLASSGWVCAKVGRAGVPGWVGLGCQGGWGWVPKVGMADHRYLWAGGWGTTSILSETPIRVI